VAKTADGVGKTSASGVTFAPAVQVIERSDDYVIMETDDDGAGYNLDAKVPGVDQLKVGSVMLIKDEAVGKIREVTKNGDRIHVRVDPVAIPDLIRNGKLSWSDASADLNHLSLFAWNDPGGVQNNKASGSGSNAPAGLLISNSRSRATAGTPARARREAVNMKVGEYDISAECIRADSGGLAVVLKASKTVGKGTINITATMDVTRLNSSGNIEVVDGAVKASEFANDVQGSLKLAIRAVKADPGSFIFDEIVNVPVEARWPVFIGGIPFAVVVKAKLLVNPILSANGTTLAMDASMTFGGNGKSGGSAQDASGSLSLKNETTLDNATGLALAASAFIVAIRPRFGFGLGVGPASAIAFTDFVATVSFTQGSSLGIVNCKQVNVVLTPRVGVETSLLGVGVEYTKPLTEVKYSDYAPKVNACKLG
jgi:hypothetical protein